MRNHSGGRSGAGRRLAFLLAALATTLLGFVATAPASAAKSAPGDNGDVKIHAVGTFFSDHRNEPHVCQFYLDAFDFDTIQQVSWEIRQQPPTGHAEAADGTLVLLSGKGHTVTMTLPAGHYKLTWNFNGEHGAAKHKVFWSDCKGVASPPPGTVVTTGGGATVGTVNPKGQLVSPNGMVVVPLLAQTGAELTPWLVAGSALLLAGGWLTHRATRRHPTR